MPAAKSRPREAQVVHGFGNVSGGITRIVRVVGYFLEKPVETAFAGVVAFHVEDLRAGRLAADAGRSGVSDGAGFGREVLNGNRYVGGVLGRLMFVGVRRAVLGLMVGHGRPRGGVGLARAGG